MTAYDMPISLEIGGVGYSIRYGWRAVVDVLIACNDPDLAEYPQLHAEVILRIMYPDCDKIPAEHLQEALQKACEFIDCGQRDDGTPKPKMIDWEQDAPLIIPEINKVSGQEIRLDPNIHWWTVFGWFMGIGDGLLASVLHIRKKMIQGKKLDDWEKEFFRENSDICRLKSPCTPVSNDLLTDLVRWMEG